MIRRTQGLKIVRVWCTIMMLRSKELLTLQPPHTASPLNGAPVVVQGATVRIEHSAEEIAWLRQYNLWDEVGECVIDTHKIGYGTFFPNGYADALAAADYDDSCSAKGFSIKCANDASFTDRFNDPSNFFSTRTIELGDGKILKVHSYAPEFLASPDFQPLPLNAEWMKSSCVYCDKKNTRIMTCDSLVFDSADQIAGITESHPDEVTTLNIRRPNGKPSQQIQSLTATGAVIAFNEGTSMQRLEGFCHV